MIEKLEITGIHLEVDEKLNKYVSAKIGKVDRYLTRHARQSVHGEVRLMEQHVKDKKNCTCEVVLHLPQETITVKESTLNIYAAVDIVEAKLKNQLIKYKQKHSQRSEMRRYSFMFWRRPAPEPVEPPLNLEDAGV
jgi:putative sigma-54 modulation protein